MNKCRTHIANKNILNNIVYKNINKKNKKLNE